MTRFCLENRPTFKKKTRKLDRTQNKWKQLLSLRTDRILSNWKFGSDPWCSCFRCCSVCAAPAARPRAPLSGSDPSSAHGATWLTCPPHRSVTARSWPRRPGCARGARGAVPARGARVAASPFAIKKVPRRYCSNRTELIQHDQKNPIYLWIITQKYI